jgi:thiol-disulfide isomerase/thioredoxin
MKKLILSLLLLGTCSLALAFEKTAYTQALFDELQTAGTPVLIDVYAPWCPTCERQQWVLSKYFEANPNSPLKVLVIDYDNQKDLVTKYKAPRQSTLILYKNNQQVWFSVAETRKRVILENLDQHVVSTTTDKQNNPATEQ